MFGKLLSVTPEHEEILGRSLVDVASELRLIDVDSLVGFVTTGRLGNIGSLVQSSCEMFFKPKTLGFGDEAEALLEWQHTPKIKLSMEFHNAGVSVFFHLVLKSDSVELGIDHLVMSPCRLPYASSARRLQAALDSARCLPTLACSGVMRGYGDSLEGGPR